MKFFALNRPGLSSATWSRRILFVLLLAIVPAHSVWSATTYYVATNGNDSNSGTSLSSPFKTIQRAMNRAVAGDTVLIRGGTYREQVEVTVSGGTATNPIYVSAYSTELPVIKGSDVVPGWVLHSGAIWKKTGWPHNSQQVFVDFDARPAKSLQQIGMPSQYYTTWEYNKPVGTGLASMTAGSFYYDPSTMTLYVWLADSSDPNKHVMEASVRRRLFFLHKPYIHLKGLAFRHSNTSAFIQQGAAVELSSNSVIEKCDIQYTDFAGLGLGYLQENVQAYSCNISNNGDSGVNAVGSKNFLVKNVKMNNNNYRNFNVLWHAGGFKGTVKTYGVLEDNEFGYNNGAGIWFDYANSGQQIVIRNNYLHDNSAYEAAIFMEVSKNGMIYNNVLVKNRQRGIYIAASDNMRVYNNTVYGTPGRAAIEIAGMPRSGATLTNNTVYNNIVSHGTSQYDLFIAPANGTTITGNTGDYNNFYRSSGSIILWSGKSYFNLAGWSTATGQDLHSLSANPNFVAATTPPSATNYAVMAGSPVIDAGYNFGSGVPFDYVRTLRPSGSAFDIGAFEAVSATGTTDTSAPVVTISNLVTTSIADTVISATATDNVGVTGMSLYVDGALKATSTVGQISYQWTNAAAGSYQIRVTASDAAQNVGSASATLTVQ